MVTSEGTTIRRRGNSTPKTPRLTWGYDADKSPRPQAEIDAEEKVVAARIDTLREQMQHMGWELHELQYRFLHLGMESAHRASIERGEASKDGPSKEA